IRPQLSSSLFPYTTLFRSLFLLDDCLTTLTLEVTFDFLLELDPQPVNMSNELSMTELMIVSFFISNLSFSIVSTSIISNLTITQSLIFLYQPFASVVYFSFAFSFGLPSLYHHFVNDILQPSMLGYVYFYNLSQ